MIKTKRIYEKFAASDGHRVLVDRLWPRGIAKEKARLDEWLRDIAPSNELRKWYGHDPKRWDQFVKRSRQELSTPEAEAQLERLRSVARKRTLTLVFSSREEKLNNAEALRRFLG